MNLPPAHHFAWNREPWKLDRYQLFNTSKLSDFYILPLLEHAFNWVGHCAVSCDRAIVIEDGPGPIFEDTVPSAVHGKATWGSMHREGQVAMKAFIPPWATDTVARFIYGTFVHEALHLADLWFELAFGPYDIPYMERQHEIRAFEAERKAEYAIATGSDKAGRRFVDLLQAHCWRTLKGV